MSVFSYQSELLTAELAATSALRMVIGQHGISLLVKNNTVSLALKSWQFTGAEKAFQANLSEWRNILGLEQLLHWNFASKICSISSADVTLVPKRLFDSDNLEQYFKLLLGNQTERIYGQEFLESFDCFLVWSAQAGLVHLCKPYFSGENLQHVAAPLLRACHRLSPEEGYAVFANLQGNRVQIIVFERQNLVFFNTFDFSKPSDLLYYILLIYKEFNLNPEEIFLTLSGTLMEDSEIFKQLFKYIRPLRFPPLPPEVQLPPVVMNLPEHYWFDLAIQ